MGETLFILGRTAGLSLLELQTFFPDITPVVEDVAITKVSLSVPPQEVILKLGGTVKIGRYRGLMADLTAETLVQHIERGHERVVFGVSVHGNAPGVGRKTLESMKKLLEGAGGSARFIESRDGKTLSSVVVEKEHVQELLIVPAGKQYIVARTIAVQPFESWNTRDFGRPFADAAAGMLPPKVSRMIVNIADQKRELRENLSQKTLLDPFCGMGTVLSEALVMGWNVVGSDVSKDVVEKARGNLRWLTEKQMAAAGVTYRLNASDAVHVSEVLDAGSIDAIVTEPFMGDPKAKPEDVKNIIKGLEKLYIGCLRDWQKVLKEHGVVVIALPRYEVKGKTYFVKKVIDMCENLGYTIVAGPIEYSRPQAVVKRAFYVFQKK